MKARSECARYVGDGLVRLNRQPTGKPHARLRVGDVLTLPVPEGRRGEVRVIRVLALAVRRGPAVQARGLYAELAEDAPGGASCAAAESSAYPRD
jgi:ribosome-associated heat shock protein Hsp15